ncbi:O-methyltransferase [Hymenopellis radicata]|nr:O-methyltransferase [Hymenopellis radicata]
MAKPKSALRLLADIISESVDQIEAHLDEAGVEFPSTDAPFDPSSPAERTLLDDKLYLPKKLVVAAAAQLLATVRHPVETVIDYGQHVHIPAALRAMSESCIVEIIRDAGPKGIHVNDIARKADTDGPKTGRLLRMLANQFVFKELSPDVFALNRLASVVDTGKSIEELKAKPLLERYNGTNGLAAVLNMNGDEIAKASTYICESFTNANRHSDEPYHSPFNLAFKTDLPLFPYYESPGNEFRLARFGMGMKGTTQMEPEDVILRGFKWHDLPKGSVLVDVGGGVGSSSLLIAKANPHLKVVVQDREAVTKESEAFWKLSYPEAISQDRVKFQAHDFFEPQPDNNATVYMMRFITHDWSNRKARQILQSVRAGARPDTRLIVIETIHYRRDSGRCSPEEAPAPLLPSFGAAENIAFWMDMTMYAYFNAQDRTLGEFVELAASSGWKVERVNRIQGSMFAQYEAVPI